MNRTLTTLEDCCNIVSGSTPDTNVDEYWGGDICWATPKDLSELSSAYIHTTPRKLTTSGLNSCSATILPVGSVLFSSRAPIGHVAINTVPMCTNQGFKSFVPDVKKVFSKFLYYWLKANKQRLENLGNGATFKEISKATVSKVQISLPPLNEQRRIAAVLDKADALREKRRQAINKLDKLLQAVFLDMFGDPCTVKDNSQVAFSSLVNRITYGFTCPMQHLKEGVPIITAKNVLNGSIDFINVHYADKSEFDALTAKSKPIRGDILITKDGTIGRCAVVEVNFPFCINQSVALIETDHNKVSPDYLVGYLNTASIQRRLKSMGKGNALQHLQITELAKLPIHFPSHEEQRKYAESVKKINAIKVRLKKSNLMLDSLFHSLQQRALNGELFNGTAAVLPQKPLTVSQPELFD